MGSRVIDVQCPNCNAPIHYNAKLGKLKCEYCDSEFDADEIKGVKETVGQVDTNYVSYNCPDCGAVIVADENTAATFCLYCGNTAILKNKLDGEFKPDKIIPFTKTKEDAVEAFKNINKGKPLVPKMFNSEVNIEKIEGLYVPFWLYEVEVDGTLEASGKQITSWRAGDRQFTKTDNYKLIREGNMTFKRVPVDGSVKLPNDLMNTLEPFYFHYLVDYNHAYLSGFYAEKYDVSKEDAYKDAKARVMDTARNVMLNDMGSYTSKVVTNNNLKDVSMKAEYALLPIWMVNVKYKGKYYMFAMNGQTGEFIGNIPLDKSKALMYAISIFAITFLVVIIIGYIFFLIGGGVS